MKNTWAVPFFAIILITSTFAFPPYYQIENQAFALDPNDGIVTTVLSSSKDSFITQGSAKDNEGANPNLRIISSDKNRPLIAFDQTEIAAATEGLVFLSATLRLNVVDNGNNWGPDGRLIGSHQILQDWTEGNGWNVGNNISGTGDGTTWNCPIDSDISNNLDDCSVQWNGGSFETVPDSTILITNDVINQYLEFDVTNDVQNFLDGTDANFGWMVKKDDESKNGTIEFASKENSENQPELVIIAQDPAIFFSNVYLRLIDELNDVGSIIGTTTITQELIDDISVDISSLEVVVIELQNLGFDGEANTSRIGQQMVGSVKFFDSQTSEILFETQIPDGALALLYAFGYIEDLELGGLSPSFEQQVELISSSLTVVQVITNFEDDQIASEIILASIGSSHPSTGETFCLTPKCIAKEFIRVIKGFGKCFSNTACRDDLREALDEGSEGLYTFFNPEVTIPLTKFNDVNGNATLDIGESGLADWQFVLAVFDPSEDPEEFPFPDPLEFSELVYSQGSTTSNGELTFQTKIPRTTQLIIVSELLQDGWEVTNPTGVEQELPFDPAVNDVYERLFFGNRQLAPPTIFFDDFIETAGWSQTSCILNHPPGQTCNIGLTPALLPVPSLPNWGFVETFDFVPGCQQLGPNVEARFSHPFTVTTNGTFALSSWVGTSPCTTCDIFSQLLVDGDAKISVKGRNLLFDPPQNRTTFQQATFDMTQGEHQITMRSFTPGGMCFGNFRTFFDDITIVGSTSPLTGPMTGGPYFYPEINQTSINATKPTTVTVPLKVEWFEGYYAEPVEIHVIGNLTDIGISSTVTSVMNSTHYKLFDVIFDIPDTATIGEHFINIFVREIDSGDREIETIQLNVD